MLRCCSTPNPPESMCGFKRPQLPCLAYIVTRARGHANGSFQSGSPSRKLGKGASASTATHSEMQ